MPYSSTTSQATYSPAVKGSTSCACPACGGLECLCRPRFFAGQLLTEEDLNRLENYIIEKNKLHNRYLFGSGVVCGLEVVCNPCQGLVTVKSGYALSPCGEDIVVCSDDSVDVCSLIKKCRNTKRRQWDCEPPATTYNIDCQDVTEEWVLAIRYDEISSRGITPLKGSSAAPSCSRCGCGGSTSCGCGCHAGQNGSTTNGGKTATRTTSAQCEPTITCEGYAYDVYKAPPQPAQPQSALVARFLACLKGLVEVLPQSTNYAQTTAQQMYQLLCAVKANLQDLLDESEIYDCTLRQKLANWTLPTPNPNPSPDPNQSSGQAYLASVAPTLVALSAEFIRYCLCSSLLPPCPDQGDSRVPLATITVRKSDCQIIRVCDWEARQVVVTFPNLDYWLSIFLAPLFQILRNALTRLCCQPFEAGTVEGITFLASPNTTSFRSASTTSSPANAYLMLLLQSLANTGRTVDAQTLALGMLGAGDASGKPIMSELEMSNPLLFLALHQLIKPMVEAVAPNAGAQVAGTTTGAAPAGAATGTEAQRLQAQLTEMQNTLKAQQAQIDALQNLLKQKE